MSTLDCTVLETSIRYSQLVLNTPLPEELVKGIIDKLAPVVCPNSTDLVATSTRKMILCLPDPLDEFVRCIRLVLQVDNCVIAGLDIPYSEEVPRISKVLVAEVATQINL